MPEPLLDRAFLERLERLSILWQKSFAGLVGGHNRSRAAGGGQEFLDHRHFHHGDDLRAVNWMAYLRLEKLFLKMFQVEPRVPVHLMLDCSTSMEAGSPGKFLYARKLAAALCYIGLVRLDTIAVHPFSNRLGEGKTCGGGRHRLKPVMDYLGALYAAGPTDLMAVTRDFLGAGFHRGLVIVLSDFLDDADALKPLQFLADYGHELLVLHLWSDEERTPPWTGELELLDAETQTTHRVQFDDRARAEYTRRFDEHARRLQTQTERSGGRYIPINTSVPVEDVIFGALVRSRGVA